MISFLTRVSLRCGGDDVLDGDQLRCVHNGLKDQIENGVLTLLIIMLQNNYRITKNIIN